MGGRSRPLVRTALCGSFSAMYAKSVNHDLTHFDGHPGKEALLPVFPREQTLMLDDSLFGDGNHLRPKAGEPAILQLANVLEEVACVHARASSSSAST